MLKLALGLMVLVSQLSGPGGGLPQILQPDFKPTGDVMTFPEIARRRMAKQQRA